jgi:hypothetical protein
MIVITNTYTQEDWEALSELEEGDVAKIQEPFVEFETVVEMSARYAPNIECSNKQLKFLKNKTKKGLKMSVWKYALFLYPCSVVKNQINYVQIKDYAKGYISSYSCSRCCN